MLNRAARIATAAALLLAACASPSASPSASTPEPSAAEPTPAATESAAPSPTTPAWTQVSPSGATPAAREDHTWTITPDGRTAYLFGGRTTDGTALADLWAYDLAANSWTMVTDDGPPARFGHNAAWVDGVGLVIFAGQQAAAFYNDLWTFDPAGGSWTELEAGGAVPVPRYGSCAAVGPDGRLWISHGFTEAGQRFADTRAYDFSTSTWTDETPAGEAPIERCLHACWWTSDGTFALYAGQTTGTTALGDLWWLSVGERPGTNTWAQMTVAEGRPAARNLYAATPYLGDEIVFGGQALDGSPLADAWWLASDGSVYPISVEAPAPDGRWGAELVADTANERVLLFGGRDGASARDDLWALTVGSGED